MPNLSQVELQNLRHLIGAHETSYQKLNAYSSEAVDPQIKQIFAKSAQDALNTKQKLMSFLILLSNFYFLYIYFLIFRDFGDVL